MKRILMTMAAATALIATPVLAEDAKAPADAVPGGHSDGTMTQKLSEEVPTMATGDSATAGSERDTKANLEGDKVKGGHSGGTMTEELGSTVPEMTADKPKAGSTE